MRGWPRASRGCGCARMRAKAGSRCATSSSPSRRWRGRTRRVARAGAGHDRAPIAGNAAVLDPPALAQPGPGPRDRGRIPVRRRHRRRPRGDRGRAASRQLGTAEPVAGDEDADLDPVRAAGIARGRGVPAPRARRGRRRAPRDPGPRRGQRRAPAAAQPARGRRGRDPARPATQERRWRIRAVLRHAGADHDLALAPGRAQRRDRGVRLVRTPAGGRRRLAAGVCRPRRTPGPRSHRPRRRRRARAQRRGRTHRARDLAQYQWTYKRYTLRPSGRGEDNPYRDIERRRR